MKGENISNGIIHTSDWHIWDKHKYSIDGSRLIQLKNSIIKIIKYAIHNNIKLIVVAGDIMNVNNPDENNMKILAELTIMCITNNIKIRYIMGDHDSNGINYSLESLNNFLSIGDTKDMLKIFPAVNNISVYSEISGCGVNIVYVPFQLKLKEAIILARKKKMHGYYNILFAHLGLNKAMASSGKRITNKITVNDLKGWDYVGLGDYHLAQRIGNIRYSGSVIRINWGERNDKKSFYYIKRNSDNSRKIKRISLLDIDFIEMKILYKNISKVILKIKNGLWNEKKIKNSFIKLFIYGNILSGDKIYIIKYELYKQGAKSVKEKIMGKYSLSEDKNKIDSLSMNVIDASEKYYKKNRKNKDNKELKFGLDLIQELI